MAIPNDDYPNSPATTGYLQTGGSVTGTLETPGDADWFRIDIDLDHAYLFTVKTADGSAPTFTVWNDTIQMVQYTTQLGGLYTNELVNAFVPFKAGSYYVEVTGAKTGSYTIGMRTAQDDYGNMPASAQPLTPGIPAAARFDYAMDNDRFRLAGVAGNAYTVTLTTDDGTLGSAKSLDLSMDADLYRSEKGYPTTTYRFIATETRDYIFAAHMASYVPPAAGGMPYHVSVSVSDGTGPHAVAVAGSVDGTIRVTFDEGVQLGNDGSITLRDEQGFDVDKWQLGSSTNMHTDGMVLTLDPTHTRVLMPGKYSLAYTIGSVTDASGNSVVQPSSASQLTMLDKTSAGGVALAGKADGTLYNGSASTTDTVVYTGRADNYIVTRDGANFKVIKTPWGKESDTLSGIERIVFSESGDTLALSPDGELGQAYRLYRAAFDRAPDKGGLGFWLHMAESGTSLSAMARGFIDSYEFTTLYGYHPDNTTFVNALYHNVLHRDGDNAGAAFWRDALAKGADRADVLTAVSESHENQEQVAALVGNGILYTPYG